MYDHIDTLPSTTDPPDTNDINIIKRMFGPQTRGSSNASSPSNQISLQVLIICTLTFFIISQPHIDSFLQTRFNIFKTSNNMLIIAKSILFFSTLYILYYKS